MNPITISINDTKCYNEKLDHVPRLYDLSKKLAFFVRYLNSNFDGFFVNGGVSGINNVGLGCYFLINGMPLNTGISHGDEVAISSFDRGFLQKESFDENEFNSYSMNFINQLGEKSIKIKRKSN